MIWTAFFHWRAAMAASSAFGAVKYLDDLYNNLIPECQPFRNNYIEENPGINSYTETL
jgi:hypothetical protein